MRRLAVAVFAGLLALSPIPAVAQGQNSAVQGRVLDESGGALPGVTVVVTHQGSGQFRQVVSNADGSYFLTNLIPGPYKVTADLTGFKKYERPDLVIQIGNTATLDITLGVGGLEESVTVSGTSPLVDVTSKQIGANIAEAEIAALPIMNKNWMFAVGLTPGIQVSSSTASFACESLIVGGGSNRSGNFSIDGAGNNDDYLGSSCGSQVRPGARDGAGIPGAHQPVRRRVRPHRRRDRQRHHQAGRQHLPRLAVRQLHEPRDDGEGLLRRAEQSRASRRRSRPTGAARSAARSGRTRRISSTASIAWSTPKGAVIRSPRGRS